MARKKVKLENTVAASVPLSSMIDVVFLLLIYFIMTQKPVVEDVYHQLNLPDPNAASAASDEIPQILRIDVMRLVDDKDEEIAAKLKKAKKQEEVNKIRKEEEALVHYTVNSGSGDSTRALSYNELKDYLAIIAKTAPKTTIVLNCDPNAKHKKLVRILDLCYALKLNNINLLNAAYEFYPDKPEKRDN